LVLLGAFAWRQARAGNPLLPLRLLRSRPIIAANAVLFLLVAGMFGFMFLTVLNLRHVLGYSPWQAACAIVPTAVAIAAVSLGASARLTARFGEWRVLLAGLAVIAAGFGLLTRLPMDAGYLPDVLPAVLCLGLGFGLAMPALMALGMSGATPGDSGLVSGLFNTTQQVGGALGLSVLAVLAAGRAEGLRATGVPETSALMSGYHDAYGVAALLVMAAFLITAIVLKPRPVPAETPAPHPA
jgi:hypothetical protein